MCKDVQVGDIHINGRTEIFQSFLISVRLCLLLPAQSQSLSVHVLKDVSVPKMQRTREAINKDAQVRHGAQLVLFIFKLFHNFNVRNLMNKSSCL